MSLTSFGAQQLRVLHDYSEAVEEHFRDLLRRVVDELQAGSYVIPTYVDEGPSNEAKRVIRRMATYFPEESAEPQA